MKMTTLESTMIAVTHTVVSTPEGKAEGKA